MPLDDRGLQNLWKELRNPKLDARYKAAAELRTQVGIAYRGMGLHSAWNEGDVFS